MRVCLLQWATITLRSFLAVIRWQVSFRFHSAPGVELLLCWCTMVPVVYATAAWDRLNSVSQEHNAIAE